MSLEVKNGRRKSSSIILIKTFEILPGKRSGKQRKSSAVLRLRTIKIGLYFEIQNLNNINAVYIRGRRMPKKGRFPVTLSYTKT